MLTLILLGILELGYDSMCVISAFLGFFEFPILTISFVFASEVAYPLKETTVNAIIRAPAVIFANIFAWISYFLLKKANSKLSCQIFIAVLCLFLIAGIVVGFLMERLDHTKIKNVEIGK